MSDTPTDDRAPSKLNLGLGPVRQCPDCGEVISTSGAKCAACMTRDIRDEMRRRMPQAIAMADATNASWQDRLRAEHRELSDRLAKLMAFISDNPVFLSLPFEDQTLMRDQRHAMIEYERALSDRIARL